MVRAIEKQHVQMRMHSQVAREDALSLVSFELTGDSPSSSEAADCLFCFRAVRTEVKAS
jgi:hypothetical protein